MKYETIYNALCEMRDEELLRVHNDYCEANSYYDDFLEHKEMFTLGMTAEEFIDKADFDNIKNTNKYFCYDGLGWIVGYDWAYEKADKDELAEWILDEEIWEQYGIEEE